MNDLDRYKARRDAIFSAGLVGVIPIGKRPKGKFMYKKEDDNDYLFRIINSPVWFATQYSIVGA